MWSKLDKACLFTETQFFPSISHSHIKTHIHGNSPYIKKLFSLFFYQKDFLSERFGKSKQIDCNINVVNWYAKDRKGHQNFPQIPWSQRCSVHAELCLLLVQWTMTYRYKTNFSDNVLSLSLGFFLDIFKLKWIRFQSTLKHTNFRLEL